MRTRLASSVAISTAVGVSFAVAISLWAQAPAPLTPSQAVAPVGGSANPDTAKAKGGGGRGRGPAVPAGPTPRQPNGKPDLVGIWSSPGPVGDVAQGMANVPCDTPGAVQQPAGRGGAKGPPTCKEPIPLTAKGMKIWKAQLSTNDPEANCLPTGVPRMAPYPWRIVQDPNHIFFLFEGNIHSFRQIFMDPSRKHPADPDPTWYGDSNGSWDGDTLVVDTIGYNDKFWFDFAGHPHSEALPHHRTLYPHRCREPGDRDHHHRSRDIQQAVQNLIHRAHAGGRIDGVHLSGEPAGRPALAGPGGS